MIKIEHVALWCRDLETMRTFYSQYFGAHASPRYENPRTRFQSYFLQLAEGARLELMQRPDLQPRPAGEPVQYYGWAHLAVSLGSREAVDTLSARLAADGYRRLDGPRTTGDGYYESLFLDPEDNRLELTV